MGTRHRPHLMIIAHWLFGAFVVGGCSGEKSSATPPTASASDASGTQPPDEASSTDTDPSNSTIAEPDVSTEPDATSPTGPRPIDPGAPTTLAAQIVYGTRLCLGGNDRLYFPNRVGYPETPGLEQLWAVSRSGGDARQVATAGSITGCTQINDEIWTARTDGTFISRANVEAFEGLPSFPTAGAPFQVAGNTTRVFASLKSPSDGAEVISIDPTTLAEPLVLWSKPGNVVALWLHANDARLLFSAADTASNASWIVQAELSPQRVTEIVTTTGELGGVDGSGDAIYYAHFERGELHKVSLDDRADTVLASLEGTWSLLVDGDYVYFTTRPAFCANREGKLYRIPVAGGEPTLLADNLDCPSQIVSDAKGLYWINAGSWQGPESPGAAPADGSVMFLPRQ